MTATDVLLIHDAAGETDLGRAIEELGYSLRCLAPGQARASLDADGQPCGMVVIDAALDGEGSGYLLAEAISAAAEVPVLLVADDAERSAGAAGRSFAVLSKPYERRKLRLRLEEGLAGGKTAGPDEGILDRLQEYSATGYWQMNPDRGDIVFSPPLRRLLGLPAAPSADDRETLLTLVHPEERELVAERYGSLPEGGEHHLEYRLIRPDGVVRVFRDSSFVERDREGRTHSVVGLLQDITETRRNEEALARCRGEVDEFAHIASHDLQEPLRATIGFMQLLKSRYADQLDDKGREFIDRSCKASERMEGLLKELLRLARISSRGGPFQPTDLNALFDRVRRQLDSAQGGRAVRIDRSHLPQAMVDDRQMTLLFSALMDNGLRFNRSEQPEIVLDCSREGDRYHFILRDNGIGIDPRFHRRIFQVFQRLHTVKEYPGMGMGLTLAKRIIERHGGEIWLESEPDEGAAFHFTLPCRES